MSTTALHEHFWPGGEVTDFRTRVPEPDDVLSGYLEAAEEGFDIEWEALAHRDVDGSHRLDEPDSGEALLDGRLRVLASSLAAGVGDVRGCLILSKEGLVLGSHPESGEVETKHAWARFAALGDLERGFAQFGAETWCFVRLGPYEAFAIIGPGARPGLVIDRMEHVLLAAEETRSDHTSDVAPPVVAPVANAAPAEANQELSITGETAQVSASSGSRSDLAEGSAGGGEGREDRTWEDARRDDEIDLFSLASEFGQL